MTALFEIAADYRASLQQLADLELPAECVADTLEGLQGELRDKLRAVIAYSQELGILAEGAKQAAQRMADRAKTLQARCDLLTEYALTHMQATGIAEIATDEWCAKLAKKPPSVLIANGATIPQQYLRTIPPPEPQPDKTALKAALQGGESIPGVTLSQGYRLSIK